MIAWRNIRGMAFLGLTLAVFFIHSDPSELRAQPNEEPATAESIDAMRSEAYQLNQYAVELANQNRFEEAIPYAKRALLLSRKVNGPQHRDVAADLFSLANLYMATGDYFSAEPLLQEAIGIDRKLFGDYHPEVAVDMGGLGLLYKKMGNYSAAEEQFLAATKIIHQSLVEGGNSKYGIQQAKLFHNLGNIQTDMQKYDAALTSYLNAEQLYEMFDKQSAIEILITMAEIKRQLGDPAAAEAFLGRAQHLSE